MDKLRMIALLLIATMLSCSKRDVGALTACMREEIAAFSTSDRICDHAVVTEYVFQNQYVYVFNSACCCDWVSEVKDAECKVIGGLGGFAGNNKVNGEDFGHAKFIREVWRNPLSEQPD
ncbi:DUF6970 domain-containing protein [Parapedobacter sp. 10938]|uniref:DUF6970 domain-containing protein n=1 Tax=Parapedobacter flavus TaxID=3110225 RepID=UPI002DB81FC5|nr:hypothetical protein [Parapedobacter sp. 10938]MEC3879690.1 hypothetical protein [Parapedobacter sp. 10938]